MDSSFKEFPENRYSLSDVTPYAKRMVEKEISSVPNLFKPGKSGGTPESFQPEQETESGAPQSFKLPFETGGDQRFGMTTDPTSPQKVEASKVSQTMAGLGDFPQPNYEIYKKLGSAAERESNLKGEQEQKKLVGEEGLYNKYTETLNGQLDFQNKAYTSWLASNDKAKEGLDQVQSKYPMMSRGDVIANMSIGQKLTTAALTMIVAGTGVPIDKNPAWGAFNQSLDDVVQSQRIGYERERANIMQKKVFDDQTFNVANAKARDDAQIRENILKNNMAMLDVKSQQLSGPEKAQHLKDLGTLARSNIDMTLDQLRLSTQQQLYSLKMQQESRKMDIANDAGKRYTRLTVPDIKYDDNGNVIVSNRQVDFFASSPEEKPKIALQASENFAKINLIGQLQQVVGKDRNAANTIIKNLEDNYKFKLPPEQVWIKNLVSSDPNAGTAKAAINDILKTLIQQNQEYIQVNASQR